MTVAKSTNTAILLFLLSITVTCTYGQSVEFISTSNTNGVQSLPLLTYGTLKLRRMLEMGLDEDAMDSYLESLPTEGRQHQQPDSSRRTSLEVGGLYQGYGTHYVDLWVGTPPQRQTVIVDTGSGVTAFPCSACSDCGQKYHAGPNFVEAESSTFLKNKCDPCWYMGTTCQNYGEDDEYCEIGMGYQEGSSWTAYQAVDQAYLGGPHHHPLDTTGVDEGSVEAGSGGEGNHSGSGVVDEDPTDAARFRFPLKFGCQTDITGLFKTQLADGIMGMCNQRGTFWHQMYHAHIIAQQQFSLCLSHQIVSERDGTVAGAITMGGTDTNLHASPMVFADGFGGGDMHRLSIRKVYFMEAGQYEAVDATPKNTKVLDIKYEVVNRGQVILDSGTTATYLTQYLGPTFRTVFMKMVGVAYDTDTGMVLTDEQLAAIPSVIVQLTGHELSNDLKFDPKDPDATPGLAGKLDSNHPNDVLVVVTPNAYFHFNPQNGRYFPRIFPTADYTTILGANLMAGHDVLFDIPKNGRIGFASSHCSYGNLVNGTHPTRPISSGRITPGTLTKNSSKDKYVCESHIYCQYRLSIFMVAAILLLGIGSGYGIYKTSRAEAQTEILNDLYLDTDDEDVVARGERIDEATSLLTR